MSETAHARWVLAIAAVATFMTALDTLVVSTALTTIRADLGADVSQLEWTVNGYNLSFAVLILVMASLGDRFGRRSLFVLGLLIFTAASMFGATSTAIEALIAARVAQGVGAALIAPLALTMVVAAYPPEKRGATLGLLGGLTGLAVASGPVIGGAIVEGLSWQWIFWVNVPLGLLCAALTVVKVPESVVPDARLDLRGAALQAAAAFGVVFGLSRANELGWGSVEVLGSFALAVVAGVLFVLVERRTTHPLLPRHLFRDRSFTVGNLAGFLMIGALFGAVFLMAQYFQASLGDSPLEAGLKLLPWTATPMVVAPLAGAVADRIGPRPVLVAGLALQGLGLGWLAAVASATSSYPELVVALTVAGVGVSMAIPSAQAAVIGSVAPQEIGIASGTVTTTRELGGVFGIAVAVAVFAANGELATPSGFADGFAPALGVAAGLSLVGALVATLVPSTTTTPGSETITKAVDDHDVASAQSRSSTS